MSHIEIHCPHCELLFDVPRSMKGGIASCPECGRTVPITSGPEPLYLILVGLAVLAVLGISGIVALASVGAAFVVLIAGLAVVGVAALMM